MQSSFTWSVAWLISFSCAAGLKESTSADSSKPLGRSYREPHKNSTSRTSLADRSNTGPNSSNSNCSHTYNNSNTSWRPNYNSSSSNTSSAGGPNGSSSSTSAAGISNSWRSGATQNSSATTASSPYARKEQSRGGGRGGTTNGYRDLRELNSSSSTSKSNSAVTGPRDAPFLADSAPSYASSSISARVLGAVHPKHSSASSSGSVGSRSEGGSAAGSDVGGAGQRHASGDKVGQGLGRKDQRYTYIIGMLYIRLFQAQKYMALKSAVLKDLTRTSNAVHMGASSPSKASIYVYLGVD